MAGVALAAGAGERLRPLTRRRAKALCPVGDTLLVDHALERLRSVTESVAVNVHHHREQMEAHLAGRVHLSFEEPEALGTAGALGALREWIDGRPALVVNSDAWCPGPLRSFVAGWDGEGVRILSPEAGPFSPTTPVAAALLPWADVAPLAAVPSGLYESVWRSAADAGRVEVVALDETTPFVDCGTPRDYLDANLLWSDGESVIGPGALVEGTVERCVLWPGVTVAPHEQLVDAVRAADGMTVLVR